MKRLETSHTSKAALDQAAGRLAIRVILTPAEEGRQAPAHRVEPGDGQDAQGLPAGHGPQGGEGPGDHHVAVHGDHRQRHHAADAEHRSAEGVQLATCRGADSAPVCQQLETRSSAA